MYQMIVGYIPVTFQFGTSLQLFVTTEHSCQGIRVELVPTGRAQGDEINKVYFYSNRQLGVDRYFDNSDSEEGSV